MSFLPSSSNNYNPFKKQPLAYYWPLRENEYMPVRHQVCMQSKPPVMYLVLSNSPNHKTGKFSADIAL